MQETDESRSPDGDGLGRGDSGSNPDIADSGFDGAEAQHTPQEAANDAARLRSATAPARLAGSEPADSQSTAALGGQPHLEALRWQRQYEELRDIVLRNVATEKRGEWTHEKVKTLAECHLQDSEIVDAAQDADKPVRAFLPSVPSPADRLDPLKWIAEKLVEYIDIDPSGEDNSAWNDEYLGANVAARKLVNAVREGRLCPCCGFPEHRKDKPGVSIEQLRSGHGAVASPITEK